MGKNFGQPEYQATRTLLKLVVGLIGGTATAGLYTALDGLPNDLEALKANPAVAVIPLGMAAWEAGRNVWKHRKKLKKGVNWDFTWMGLFLIASMLIVGCQTTTKTIKHPDGTTEEISERNFDPEAWDLIVETGKELNEIAAEYREQQAQLDAEERAAKEREIRQRALILQALIESSRKQPQAQPEPDLLPQP